MVWATTWVQGVPLELLPPAHATELFGAYTAPAMVMVVPPKKLLVPAPAGVSIANATPGNGPVFDATTLTIAPPSKVTVALPRMTKVVPLGALSFEPPPMCRSPFL